MKQNSEERLIVEMSRDAAPEFRTRHNLFDHAYSGPEQRRRVEYRLEKDFRPRMRATATELPDTALAA